MYDIKALYEAESVEHAVRLLMEHPEAQIIAGGSDVLVQMREGKRAGKELVSIYGLDEMRGVSYEEDGAIRIGSLMQRRDVGGFGFHTPCLGRGGRDHRAGRGAQNPDP